MQRILQIAAGKSSLVLDSFAGSGTTGHAVPKQDTRGCGHHSFIRVEMDPLIARKVTAERVRRVAWSYASAKGETRNASAAA